MNNLFAPVLASACDGQPNVTSCQQSRGNVFAANSSESWRAAPRSVLVFHPQQGPSLAASADDPLYAISPIRYNYTTGQSVNTTLGNDNLGLGWTGPSSTNITYPQLVAGFVDDSKPDLYHLGRFGLSPGMTNSTNSNPNSLLDVLSSTSLPSGSWGYTAGFHGASPPALGSLVFGGFDASRFEPNHVTASVLSSSLRPRGLRMYLLRISTDKTDPLFDRLADGYARVYFDSEVSTLILPRSACTAFESAFNLTRTSVQKADNTTSQSYYLLNDTQHHDSLLALNASVTFSLGSDSSFSNSNTVNITLPYAAFDQQLSPPLVQTNGTPTRYFPLQCTDDTNGYVLGRTFMQHAYIIADYDRGNFSVSQALFPPAGSGTQIKSIAPPAPSTVYRPPRPRKQGLSAGAIAGAVVGAVAGATVLALGAFLQYRRRRRGRRTLKAESSSGSSSSTQLPSELDDPQYSKHELRGNAQDAELGAGQARQELDGKSRLEMPEKGSREAAEMEAAPLAELEGSAAADGGEKAGKVKEMEYILGCRTEEVE